MRVRKRQQCSAGENDWGRYLRWRCALPAIHASATGVPISGFYPFAGISLTDKFSDDDGDPLHRLSVRLETYLFRHSAQHH